MARRTPVARPSSASHARPAKAAPPRATLTLHRDPQASTIDRNIYGHFAEHLGRGIYEGIWVGEDSKIPNRRGIRSDVVAALRRLQVPVLRWPGGCFADEYHWRDGIGPRAKRPRRINTHWGGVLENNHFGTHEFMDLCEQIGAEPYVCGNVGSGTPREMMEWVEYMTCDADSSLTRLRRKNGRKPPWSLRYFGVGNESWGCGGNMRPEYYADLYRHYQTFVKNYGDNRIERIACGSSGDDLEWTEVLMSRASRFMQGLSLHWYTLPTGSWERKGDALRFDEAEWHSTFVRALHMDTLLGKHGAIMDRHDPERRVALVVDEWGSWYDPTPGSNPGFLEQQNSLRDALVAAVSLHVFQRHSGRVRMANIAQTVNVLQAMILTDQARMLLTPTYHVFEMYKVHQGASWVPLTLQTPAYTLAGKSLPMLHASASRDASGTTHLSLVNLHPRRSVNLNVTGLGSVRDGRLLTAPEMASHNSFERPDAVVPVALHALRASGKQLELALPPKSVAVLAAR